SHDPSCQDTRRNHSTESNCICLQGRPPRRNDPRYLPIGKAYDDPFIKTVPIRGKKRLRTASSSPSRSASPTKGSEEIGDDDGFPETIIPKEEAAQTISEFRQNVISAGNSRCAVTGKGSAWWAGDCIGPGVQAAHIVPQVHWNVYPDKNQGVAALDDIGVLRDAWMQTWHMSNGLLLAAHIHYSFDARILSIDPDTRRIRVFMPYDLITEYHGKVAALPPKIDLHALRHHYDMCPSNSNSNILTSFTSLVSIDSMKAMLGLGSVINCTFLYQDQVGGLYRHRRPQVNDADIHEMKKPDVVVAEMLVDGSTVNGDLGYQRDQVGDHGKSNLICRKRRTTLPTPIELAVASHGTKVVTVVKPRLILAIVLVRPL
ncbi:hypothetical protein F5883DRAFT_240516, partial [Diaporthe sp. PMI_573]